MAQRLTVPPATNIPWFSAFVQSIEALFAKWTPSIRYLRKDFTFADDGTVISLGSVPANALILYQLSGVQVEEVFNAGTLNELDIGTSGNDDLFATNIALGAVGWKPLDENVAGYRVSTATELTATVNLTGTAATTGIGCIVIAYCPEPT